MPTRIRRIKWLHQDKRTDDIETFNSWLRYVGISSALPTMNISILRGMSRAATGMFKLLRSSNSETIFENLDKHATIYNGRLFVDASRNKRRPVHKRIPSILIYHTRELRCHHNRCRIYRSHRSKRSQPKTQPQGPAPRSQRPHRRPHMDSQCPRRRSRNGRNMGPLGPASLIQ